MPSFSHLPTEEVDALVGYLAQVGGGETGVKGRRVDGMMSGRGMGRVMMGRMSQMVGRMMGSGTGCPMLRAGSRSTPDDDDPSALPACCQ